MSSNKSEMKLAEQFASITGASTAAGLRALAMCNGDLQRAVSMHLDGVIDVDAIENEQQGAANIDAPGPSIPPDDSVRAPIPSKMDTLVEDIPRFGPHPRQRRPRQSIFDGLRDFQAETRLQEEMIRDPKLSSRKRTLEDLFRPPLDLMHKGTFITAREAGQAQGKWLMVNVQNVREFTCQALNRDVWSDTTIKSIIRESFIFWQIYHDSDEGRRYMQFYKVTEFPYVAILDPRTGEQMATWNRVDTESFCDVVMQFLCDHKMDMPDVIPLSPPADSPSSSMQPAKKKARTDSIIDASEESQIEAAIAASLAEAEAAEKRPNYERKSSVIAIASDSEEDDDDDDDAVETIDSDFNFSDSDSVCEEQPSKAAKVSKVSPSPTKTKTTPKKRSSPSKTNNASKSTNGVIPKKRTLFDLDGDGDENVIDVDKNYSADSNVVRNSCSKKSKIVAGEDSWDTELAAVGKDRTENGCVKTGARNGQAAVLKRDGSEELSVSGKLNSADGLKVKNSQRDETDSKVTKEPEKADKGSSETREDDETSENSSGPTARILLRFPDGRRKEICLSEAATLKVVIRQVAQEGYSEEKYELLTNYPRRRLSLLDSATSLSDAGLCPQESIFVQER